MTPIDSPQDPLARFGQGSTVSGQITHEPRQAINNVTRVRVAHGPLLGPVLCRVVSMVLARAAWPMDRLDDALLVCDALSAHAPAHASDGRLTFSVQANEQEAELRVQDLTCDGATALARDTMLPGVGNLLERIAERVSVEPDEQGSSELVLVLSAS